jgi:hypothetical protein
VFGFGTLLTACGQGEKDNPFATAEVACGKTMSEKHTLGFPPLEKIERENRAKAFCSTALKPYKNAAPSGTPLAQCLGNLAGDKPSRIDGKLYPWEDACKVAFPVTNGKTN